MAYNYLFCHSCPMDSAEVASNYSNLSISIDNELTNVIVTGGYDTNELCTKLWSSSVLCEEQFMTGFVNYTVSSSEGCRPGGGAGGCKTNNACTKVHAALNGQVSCLSCIFSTGQYSSLDFNDLCLQNITNNATCPPPPPPPPLASVL